MTEAGQPFQGVVYVVWNRVNVKLYVGQSIVLMWERWKQHKTKAKHGKRGRFYTAVRKHGVENFFPVELESGLYQTQQDLDNAEDRWMKEFRSMEKGFGYNTRGAGSRGAHSKETREKMSKMQSNRSLAHRAKISENNRNRVWTQASKDRARESHLGYKHPPEARVSMKLAQAKIAREHPELAIKFLARVTTPEAMERHRERMASSEMREKLRKSHLGQRPSLETVAKATETRFKTFANPDVRAEMSVAQRKCRAEEAPTRPPRRDIGDAQRRRKAAARRAKRLEARALRMASAT